MSDDDSKKPPFKPGDKPYCFLGNELLNGNIDWKQTLIEVIYHGPHGFSRLADILEVSTQALTWLYLHGDFSCLTFKKGARLNTLHDRYVSKEHKS